MTSPRTLLNGWQINAKKQLGQHFLRHANVAEKIITGARIQSDDIVLEIGAGLGALTIPLAREARQVYAVETDRRITGLLKTEIAAAGLYNVRVIEKDFLKLEISDIAEEAGGRLVAMGNLPYNISSQVLIRLIMARRWIDRAVLMFQKELADRLMAPPGTKTYGRITVMLAYCAGVDRLCDIPAESFYPRPKVDSTVLRIHFKQPLTIAPRDEPLFFRVVKAGFSQRRKTLKNALSNGFQELPSQTVIQALTTADIDPMRRAETLTPEEFIRLSDCMLSVSQLAR